MNAPVTDPSVLRIMILALGGEGGGVLMNWIVQCARESGLPVQATSVPGVAQRTGATNYYVEISLDSQESEPVLALVPMAGRVDVVIASELVEAARAMENGFVSPDLTTLIASTSRVFSTIEKIALGDGRFEDDNIKHAATVLAKDSYLLDLQKIALANKTFISAAMFGALAGSGVLPWSAEVSRRVFGSGAAADASLAGFNVASDRVGALKDAPGEPAVPAQAPAHGGYAGDAPVGELPEALHEVVGHGYDRCVDYQDKEYGALFESRVGSLHAAAAGASPEALDAVNEAARRLSLWMTYEDMPRVADLKTRPERFERIREESAADPDQILSVTEFMKPRLEEIADSLPGGVGGWLMRRAERGARVPFIGDGIRVRSNGVVGHYMLKAVAGLRRFRRKSMRFHNEQTAIEQWLDAMRAALAQDVTFSRSLAELPRVLKGYSDTQARGKKAYDRIFDEIVSPAIGAGSVSAHAPRLATAISAALADEKTAGAAHKGIEVKIGQGTR